MLWKTHITGGVIAGTLLSSYFTTDLISQAVFISCSGAGALLPDIDSIHSKLGRVFMPVSATLQLIFGHRGIFHTLLLPIILSGALHFFFPIYDVYLIPLFIGYISHILMDLLNPEGVPLFWPIKTRFSIPLVETGGIIERVLFMGLTFMAALVLARVVITGGGL